jgi:hypothetical protein
MSIKAEARIIGSQATKTRTDRWPEVSWPYAISSSVLSQLVSDVLNDANFAETVKSLVEGYAVESIVRSLETRVVRSDPFDPIYLADLKPDHISQADARQVWDVAAKVKDLSLGIDLFEEE